MPGKPTENLKAQHVLFLSLWAVLILTGAIWKFWPSREMNWNEPAPPVHIGEELTLWFDRGTVTEILPSRYTVELVINPQYRERLSGEAREVSLRFHLRGEENVLFEGNAPCRLSHDDSRVQVRVENPRRVTARAIDLYLAH